MFSEDYLMRMINLAVAALVQAIGLRKEGKYELANQSIDQALEQLTGLRAGLLRQLDDQGILSRLYVHEEIDPDWAALVAELYYEQGNIHTLQNQPDEACFCYRRALLIFLEVALSNPDPLDPDQKDKIDRLFALTKDCQLPFDTQFNLYSYYESSGAYAKAENTLAKLLETNNFPLELIEEYEDFCQRLAEKPDAEIENGGVSRTRLAEMTHWIETKQNHFP